jgi:hypothetical protein
LVVVVVILKIEGAMNKPSLVRTDGSGEGGGAFCLCLFTLLLERGRGFTEGEEAGSIFHGDTLSGRGIVEGSSQRT